MSGLKYTLVSEGTTDAQLTKIIDWTFQCAGIATVEGRHAEFWRLKQPPSSLNEKLIKGFELYPSDVLIIHRDSDREDPVERNAEILRAVEEAWGKGLSIPAVAVIPVRMLEAWLLTDESAIRKAAGNPNGRSSLNLPSINKIESRPDPKSELRDALRRASELSSTRLKRFDVSKAFWRIMDYTDDFTPLRQLSAFVRFENSVRRMVANRGARNFYCEP